MATYNLIGYLTAFDGTTLINHSTLCAISVAQQASIVALRTYVLPNGTIVNYDGTSDAALTPGQISQEIMATSGGIALHDALAAKIGNYGTLTLTQLATGTVTANAILTSIEDISDSMARADAMKISLTFQLVGDWA